MVRMPLGVTENVKPNITFMRVGVSNVDTFIVDPMPPEVANFKTVNAKWTLYTLQTIIKILNHTNVRF